MHHQAKQRLIITQDRDFGIGSPLWSSCVFRYHIVSSEPWQSAGRCVTYRGRRILVDSRRFLMDITLAQHDSATVLSHIERNAFPSNTLTSLACLEIQTHDTGNVSFRTTDLATQTQLRVPAMNEPLSPPCQPWSRRCLPRPSACKPQTKAYKFQGGRSKAMLRTMTPGQAPPSLDIDLNRDTVTWAIDDAS